MDVLTGPAEKRAELVWKDHEVEDERYRSQHEYQVSHRLLPCALHVERAILSK
jgi:hypothetical protein